MSGALETSSIIKCYLSPFIWVSLWNNEIFIANCLAIAVIMCMMFKWPYWLVEDPFPKKLKGFLKLLIYT